MSDRRTFGWRPVWDGSIAGWAVKYAHRHAWKTEPDYGADDLISEAWIVFDRCRTEYPQVIEPAHFQSLFMSAFSRRVVDLSRRTTMRRTTSLDDQCGTETGESHCLSDVIPSEFNGVDCVEISMLLDAMPTELRGYLDTLLAGTDFDLCVEGRKRLVQSPRWRGLRKKRNSIARESWTDYFSRMTNADGRRVCDLIRCWLRDVESDLIPAAFIVDSA